jgi:hypothetical protein
MEPSCPSTPDQLYLKCFRCFPPIEARPLNFQWDLIQHHHDDDNKPKRIPVTSCDLSCPNHPNPTSWTRDLFCKRCQDCIMLWAKLDSAPETYERVACGMFWCKICPQPRPARKHCWGCGKMYLVTEGKQCECVRNK